MVSGGAAPASGHTRHARGREGALPRVCENRARSVGRDHLKSAPETGAGWRPVYWVSRPGWDPANASCHGHVGVRRRWCVDDADPGPATDHREEGGRGGRAPRTQPAVLHGAHTWSMRSVLNPRLLVACTNPTSKIPPQPWDTAWQASRALGGTEWHGRRAEGARERSGLRGGIY